VLTVKLAVPLIEPEVAVIVTEPGATAVATPPLLMVANAAFDELHKALFVRF
jgi:hypothetical protein